MAHTNSTPNYNLPQFLGTDKPAWLTDVNNAMSDIDAAIAAAKSTADSADAAVSALGITVGNHNTQLSTLSGAVTSQGNTLNAVTALIGNGTPTTTDQTIIGAINEINAGITTVSIPTDTNKIKIYKNLKTTEVNLIGLDYATASSFTVPDGYRPKSILTVVGSNYTGAALDIVFVSIDASGNISVQNSTGAVVTDYTAVTCSFTYIN